MVSSEVGVHCSDPEEEKDEGKSWVRCPPIGTEHPVIYLSTENGGRVRCPYCGKEFTGKTET